MPKDMYIPVYLCALSTHRLYGSCEEVSSVIGVPGACTMTQSILCVCTVNTCIYNEVFKSKNYRSISFCRCKHQAVSKQLCGLLTKLPSLRLQRGVRSGRKIHGHLVVSFTVQRSFVMRVRVSGLHHTACSAYPCSCHSVMCDT